MIGQGDHQYLLPWLTLECLSANSVGKNLVVMIPSHITEASTKGTQDVQCVKWCLVVCSL
jgi:hypothetical protein